MLLVDFGATTKTISEGELPLFQKLIVHKNIQSTLKYTQLVHFKDDEFDVTKATTVDEVKELLAAGLD